MLGLRKQYIISYTILILCYIPIFISSKSFISRLLLPFILLYFSGYSLTHVLFNKQSQLDKIIIGFGISISLNVIIFHSLVFFRVNSQNQMFNNIFLTITFLVTSILLYLSFSRVKNSNHKVHDVKNLPKSKFNQYYLIFLGIIILLVVLTQTLLIEIKNRSLDEYAYIYIAKNLITDNTNFTATPPWINKERYVPRYVFITQISVICSFIGFELESAELFIIISNLMLIIVVYALASTLYNKKVGIIAATLIAANPVFWLLSIRIYPDIPVTVFSWSSFYFLLKAFKTEKTDLDTNKYVIVSVHYLILAIFTKYTVVLLLPAFFLVYYIYTRNRNSNELTNSSSLMIVRFMIVISLILAIVRFWPDIATYTSNLSTLIKLWNLQIIYDTMINPLGPISQFSALILLGMLLSSKTQMDKRNLGILIVAWAGYIPFFMLVPHFLADQRHVFAQQVSVTIIAALGIYYASKNRNLWIKALFIVVIAHAIDVILSWNSIQQTTILLEVIIFSVLLVALYFGIQKTTKYKMINLHSVQTAILLCLTLVAFANVEFLDRNNITWEEQIRDESRTQATIFLNTVGEWMGTQITENENIMTNAYATLPYYSGFLPIYSPPKTETQFLRDLNQYNITYIILFWGTQPFLRHVLGGMTIPDEAPYLETYVLNPLSNTTQIYWDSMRTIDNEEVGVIIYKLLS